MTRLLGSVALTALCAACATPSVTPTTMASAEPTAAPTPHGKPSATTVSVGGDVTVTEGGIARVPITKTGQGTAKFNWQTVPGTASADVDYVTQSGSLDIDTDATLEVPTLDDRTAEPGEKFTVVLSGKAHTTIGDGESVVTITDNDSSLPPEPITCSDGSTVIPPATCPEQPPPSGGGDIPSNGLTGLAPINSVDPMLATKPDSIPPSADPDVVGAFRFTCGMAGLGRFDPKVYPGDTTGKSHGHQFYGNAGITSGSTYESLRTTGASTCAYGEFPANRAGYWQPWLEDGRGHVLQSDIATVYYKRRPPYDPVCSDPSNPQYQGQCVEMPNGLFYIFGYDMVTNTPATGSVTFTCQLNGGTVYVYGTMAEAATSGRCVAGGEFGIRAHAPSCWNGKLVDSANHRDHMAYPSYGSWGYVKCPATHPYVIPEFALLTTWRIVEGDDLTLWRFSSDHAHPELPAGATFHADFFMAWEPGVHAMWETPGCLGKKLNCFSGVTGNGRIVNHAANPIYPDPVTGEPVGSWQNPYRVVPIPGAEANVRLWGPSYGNVSANWATKVKPNAKALKEPHWLTVMRKALDELAARPVQLTAVTGR
jgi:hypothetical protein